MTTATYHSSRIGENVFQMCGMTFQFVNVKTSEGVEEGVYCIQQDICYTLSSWQSYYLGL
jgi:hypothetical protein